MSEVVDADGIGLENIIRDHFLPLMSESLGQRVDLLCTPAFERVDGDYVATLCIHDEPTISVGIQIPSWWLDKSQKPLDLVRLIERQLRYACKRLRAASR